MRLSAIILQGFKSFRESTRIQFDANPVVIIGPNGCGKSNTVDAVRWVLGESSARQLRGGTLSDVISNGGGSRPAASVATVELRFDNSDGAAPGAFAEAAEISVRRSLDRKGDGHYRINGARCRRRDVGDLFLGTGLGGNAYAIVEQGTIGRIVDARPDDLRAILEEAGGISRYKERRRETTQRIAETREHLQRLHDIHGEMDGQWRRLQRQAESAQRLRALRVEERQWQWWGLALRVDALEAERRQSLEQRSRLQAKYRREEGLFDAVTQSLDQLRAEDRRMQENIAAAQGELYAVQARQSDMEHQLREQQAALQRAQTSLDQRQAQQQKVRSEQIRQAEDQNQRQRRLQDLAVRRQALSGEEDSARRLRREAERELEKQDEERQNQQQALAEMRRKRDVTTAQIRELEPRLEDIERRLQQQSANIPSERTTMEALAVLCDAAETVLAEVASDLRTHRDTLEALQTRIAVLRNARDDTQAKAQEYGARQKALEGLLQRLQKPLARNDPAGSQLVDQMRVQPGWERALEEALG
ncbi:AAA family ATPase, partial [Acidithiobacillus sp.]|uniref:AAA family ATPase n=1 Tax=Acidithiobacillus sp. TaxID=1872118 RepID=UPI00356A7BBA